MDSREEKRTALPPSAEGNAEGQKKSGEEKEKKSGFRRWLTLLLVLAAVLAVVVLTTMEDGRHFASLRRWLMYGSSGETANLYTYAADQSNRYAMLGEDLLVVTPNSIQLLQDDGTVIYDLPVSLSAPVLSVGDEQAAVCDAGGNTLYVLDRAGILRTMSTEGSLCYYTARMSEGDYLAVTEEKSGYKASVSVYDRTGELLFHFDSYDSYISDAVVTEDGRNLVAVSLDVQDGVFASRLLVYDLSSAQRTGEITIRDGLVLDLSVNGDRMLSLCDKRLSITTLAGETLLDLPYGNLYLHDYALTGEDFCALLLGQYQSGNVCTLTTYDLDGTALGSLELSEEVLDISAAGEYLAVLYSDSLVLYTRDLQEHSRLEDTGYAGRVLMEDSGTAVVISASSAWRFLP